MTAGTFNIFDRDENLVVANRQQLEALVEGMYWSQIKKDLDKGDMSWWSHHFHGKAPNISAMSDDELLRAYWDLEEQGIKPLSDEDDLPRAPDDAEPDVPVDPSMEPSA